ncbi:MAG TPA: HAD family hydrolase [Jatrophihabitantaceae bacterium]|nr:HAD family hydrolase [Jatrophihabitantaceae bacterium]
MTIEAVIFDWGGTLTPWHSVDALGSWLAAVGDEQQAVRLLEAERAVWLRCIDEHRSARLDDVFAEAGIDHTPEMLAAFHTWWEPHTYLDPDVEPLFAGLHERDVRIGVLSNTIWPGAEHDRIFERDQVMSLIHGAVYSSEIPWTKPHPEAFRAAMRSVGVDDPARVVFVGDRPFEDIHGAKQVGMKAVLVPHSEIPAEQLRAVEGEPDAVIDRLLDLLDLVDRW